MFKINNTTTGVGTSPFAPSGHFSSSDSWCMLLKPSWQHKMLNAVQLYTYVCCRNPGAPGYTYAVCYIRSGVTRCTLLMVLYLDRMCQRGLHAVLWSHIGTLIHHLAAEPCSTGGVLFPSRCPSGTILLTPYSMVWDWRVSRAGPMLIYWPKLLYPY